MRKPDRPNAGQIFRCAIYTRKSSEDGLEQEFNSLDAQREACEAYVTSQYLSCSALLSRSRHHSRSSCGPASHRAHADPALAAEQRPAA
jgi:hypothetical protein